MSSDPCFLATGIGSMPFSDPQHAINVSLSRLSDAPLWPQLPKLGLTEQMEIQYSEGMPRFIIDKDKHRGYFDTTGDYSDTFADFYERYIGATDAETGTGDFAAAAISEEYAHGLYALERRLKAEGKKYPYLKVQTTGPCSFALTVVDQDKRAIYYNDEFRDIIVKALAMKCRWQIQLFQPYAEKIICFVDEPILSAFGSSTYVSVKREDVVVLLAETVEAIHAENALAGIHCCGNTEWSIPIDAYMDIINFDAFQYGETIAMYPEAVGKHLERGGMLAWGVVPTSPAIREQTVDSLTVALEKGMDRLAVKGIDKQKIARQAIITPSCGTGSLEPADAERVFELTQGLSVKMKEKYGF